MRPLLVAWLLLALPWTAHAEAMVRIAIAERLPSVAIRGERMRLRAMSDEGGYRPVEGGVVTLAPAQGGIRVEGAGLVSLVKGDPPSVKLRADGPITVADKVVRGSVEIQEAGGSLVAINEIPMEAYLAAVLGSEMPPTFPAEALKAQAVAARTYAIGKKIVAEGEAFHLGSSVLSQVYGGVNREDPRTLDAVRATEGEVLVFEHAPIEAYFFASCGGRTEDGLAALSRDLPYLTAHACPEKKDTPGASWTLHLSAAELGRRLGFAAPTTVRVVARTSTGRARAVVLDTPKGARRVDAVTFRRKLGYSELKSLSFTVEPAGSGFRFKGKGSGHGAGMCQWGAAAAAGDGWDYRRILELYYPGTELRRMY
ncbi:MAG TPA: SpoIID/LytB domain-containing protein [Vulgatibacter sp.]